MKKRILALVGIVALVGMLVPATVFSADDEGTVTCTVTAVLVAVTVEDGDVLYGTLALGANTTTIDLGDTQTATNNGTVAEDFSIKTSNAIRDGGTTWTVVTGTPGSNEFKHEFSINSGSTWAPMTTTYTSNMGVDVAVSSNQTFDLRITMPGTTDDYQEHTITVTVLATQH